MKTILVAGGAGFLGSNLIVYLLEREPQTKFIVVDNLLTGRNKVEHPNVHFINFDITDSHFVEYMYLHQPICSEIWNFACPASPKQYRRFPMETIAACTTGVINLCELALLWNSKLIHASTSEVYGQTNEPMYEQNPGLVHCIGPRACYDEGKRIAETILVEQMNKHPKLRAHICRLFNTYGPGMSIADGRIIPNVIARALHGDTVYLYGSSQKIRSFCYVTDTLAGMLKVANSSLFMPVNIGNDTPITLLDLVNKIQHNIGVRKGINPESVCDVVVTEHPLHDPIIREPVLHTARIQLGYKPVIDLITGLAETITWFEKQFEDPVVEELYQSISQKEFQQAYENEPIFSIFSNK